MSLKKRLIEERNISLRNKEKVRKSAIVQILSSVANFEINNKVEEASDNDILSIIITGIKQRKDSVSQFTEGGRLDLAKKEQDEILFLEEFLPKQMPEAELISLIEKTIVSLNAKTRKDMKIVMSNLTPKVKGRADMKFVSSLVIKNLS